MYKLGDKFWLQNSNTFFTIDAIENELCYGYLEDADGIIRRTCFSVGDINYYIVRGVMTQVK